MNDRFSIWIGDSNDCYKNHAICVLYQCRRHVFHVRRGSRRGLRPRAGRSFEAENPGMAARGWRALRLARTSGEFIVGAGGEISLPMLGRIEAAGHTAATLSDMIGARLQSEVGLVRKVQTSLEVTEHRPFYIAGGVDKPGEYPDRPGITVIEAISLAGGLYRKPRRREQSAARSDPGARRAADAGIRSHRPARGAGAATGRDRCKRRRPVSARTDRFEG